MKKIWIITLLIQISCSQDRDTVLAPGSSDALNLSSYIVNGVVIDYEAYLDAVTICLDKNQNLKCDPEEVKTKSSTDGSFSLNIGEFSELSLLAEIQGQDSYYLTSNLAECSYEKTAEGLCQLNITPFTYYLDLSKITDDSKPYEELRDSSLALFSKHVEGFNDIDLDYISSDDASLGLVEVDFFKAFKVLAKILVNVAVSTNVADVTTNDNEGSVVAPAINLQEEVAQVIKAVDTIFQEIEAQDIQILDLELDVESDFQEIDQIISSAVEEFIEEPKLDIEPAIDLVETAVNDTVDQVETFEDDTRDVVEDTISNVDSNLIVEKPENSEEFREKLDIAEIIPTPTVDPIPAPVFEPIVDVEPVPEAITKLAPLPPPPPPLPTLPELPEPSISLFENDQQTNLFLLKDQPVKVEVASYADTFVKYQTDNQSIAETLDLSDTLSTKIYADANCTTSVPSSPVIDLPGVLELDLSQFASQITQIYTQIEYADKKSACSAMTPEVAVYSLDDPNFICNNTSSLIGSGASIADPKIICNVSDFKTEIRNFPDNYFVLGTDIDLSPPQEADTDNYDIDGWIPIQNFSGGLDGNNQKIIGLSINRPSEDEQGLFGQVKSGATISDLILGEPQAEQKPCNPNDSDANNDYLGCDIVFANEGGALVGLIDIEDKEINISNVVNNYSVYATNYYGSGLIGRVDHTTHNEPGKVILSDLRNQQAISGKNTVGGILGFFNTNTDHSIIGSKLINTGTIWSVNGRVGGVIGQVTGAQNIDFKELENSGIINSSGEEAGGVIGHIYGANVEKIKNTGKVISSSDRVGGILGNANSSTINYCWNTGDIVGRHKVGGILGFANALTLNNSRNSGSVLTYSNTGNDIGGIVGVSYNSTLQKLFNNGVITGNSRAAGIVGSASGDTLNQVINHGFIAGGYSLGGIVAGVSTGDITIISAHNAATVAAKSWKLGSIIGYYYNSKNEIRKIRDVLSTGGLQGSYNVGDSTHMGGVIGSVSEQGVADPGISLVMLSMERVLNLNSAYHDTSPPETFGIMFGEANYWGGVILKQDIWAGASQFSPAELPSPAPKMSAYGVKANLAPITDTGDPNNFGTNTLMLCIDADDSDGDGDVCTHANPISAADFYSDSTIGLDSSSNWKLGPAIFSESIALGDGNTENFTAILQLDTILAGSVKIKFIHGGAVRTAVDDGLGNFSADWLDTGTIDYNTGEVNLQFNSGEAPEDNEAVSIQYTSVDSVPVLNFTWDWEDNPNNFPWAGSLIP